MSERFDPLAARRRDLLLRSEAQRQELGALAKELAVRLGGLNRSLQLVRSVVGHPAVAVGGFAAVAMLGPRRLLNFASRGARWKTIARQALRVRQPD